jgi:hypothetical protein
VLTPIRKNAFRWETPFPVKDLNMVGHLILRDSTCILFDPPCVPGLVDSVKRLGDNVAIILTSQNHTRGTKYIASKTGATVYIPEQDPRAVDPKELLAVKEIGEFQKYREGEVLGMKVFKDFYDFAILTDEKELVVSDNATGTADGRLLCYPEYTPDEPPEPNATIHGEFKKLVQRSGATSLFAGHGYDIRGNLQELAARL